MRICKFIGHVIRNEESIEKVVVQGQVKGKKDFGVAVQLDGQT